MVHDWCPLCLLAQVVASEADGGASKSEVRQVALSTAKTGVGHLVTPRGPFPLQNSRMERLMLWLDWTRTFNKYPSKPWCCRTLARPHLTPHSHPTLTPLWPHPDPLSPPLAPVFTSLSLHSHPTLTSLSPHSLPSHPTLIALSPHSPHSHPTFTLTSPYPTPYSRLSFASLATVLATPCCC